MFGKRQDARMADDKTLMPEWLPSHLWNETTAVLQSFMGVKNYQWNLGT